MGALHPRGRAAREDRQGAPCGGLVPRPTTPGPDAGDLLERCRADQRIPADGSCPCQAIASIDPTVKTVIQGLKDTIDEGVNAGGKMAMCSEACVGKSLIHAVGVVRAQMLNQPLPLAHPMVCNTTPQTIDPSDLVLHPQHVTYTGFYLASSAETLFLVDKNGSKTDVTAGVTNNDAFSDAVDVGGANGVKVGTSAARLDLVNDSGTYNVTFNPPGLPACIARTPLGR